MWCTQSFIFPVKDSFSHSLRHWLFKTDSCWHDILLKGLKTQIRLYNFVPRVLNAFKEIASIIDQAFCMPPHLKICYWLPELRGCYLPHYSIQERTTPVPAPSLILPYHPMPQYHKRSPIICSMMPQFQVNSLTSSLADLSQWHTPGRQGQDHMDEIPCQWNWQILHWNL